MEKNYRIVLTNGDKFVVKASGKESARKEALKRKELDRFGVHIDKIELVEMASFKDYLNKVAEAKTANMKKVVESDVDDKPETEMSKYKRKAVQGLYHFDHWEHPDGSFIQVHVRRKPFQGLHQDGSTGKRTKFDNFNDLKNHVNKVAEDADFDHNQRNSKPKRVGDEKKGVKESESFTPDYKQTSTSINTKTNPTDTMAALDFIEKRAKLINKKSDDSSTSYLYDLGQAGKISVVVMARDPKYYPKGMTEIKGPVNIVLGWLGKRGVTENADFDYGETDGKPTKMKGPFGNNTDAMSKQGRADIKQRVTNARYGDNPLEEGEDHQTNLDRLKDILNELGANDDSIIAGVSLTPKGKQQIAGRLGVAADTIDTMISSLQSHMSADQASHMLIDSEINETKAMTLAQAKAELSPLGIVLSHSDGEYRVNFKGGAEETASYQNDIEDAVGTGKHMAAHKKTKDEKKAKKVKEATWHQQRRPVDPSSPGKWNVHDNPPGNPAGIMSFGSKEDAQAYIDRRKKLGTGDHCYLIPPREERVQKPIKEEDTSGRYSAEIDGLGSITLRDSITSETKFLQGTAATELAKRMEPFHNRPQLNNRLQEVLKTAFLNEASALDGFFLKEFRDDKSFENEIASDSGTYNMPWKLGHHSGTMTIFYTLENDKPELKIQSVRDEDGNEVEVDDVKHDELMVLARDFIGNE